MPRSVLLTGASGLLGTWLQRTVPDDVELVALVHRTPGLARASVRADLRDPAATAAALSRVRPSLVVHAAVALDAASIVDATANVVSAATAVGAEVLHLSTEAVFAGDGRPRAESSVPDPGWDYGRWKAQAEELVVRASPRSAVIRLPLLVSLDPEDRAVAQVREGARHGRPTRWFRDELRQPAMAADVAPALWRIAGLAPDRRAGAWHLPGPESLSRYDIARRITEVLHLDASSVVPVPAPRDGSRPRRLHLRADRACAVIGWDPAPVLR